MCTVTTSTVLEPHFQPIDAAALTALGAKGRADPSAVRTVKCRTVAQGRRFRHLNFIRDLPAHIVDEPPALLGDDTAPNPTEALLAALGLLRRRGSPSQRGGAWVAHPRHRRGCRRRHQHHLRLGRRRPVAQPVGLAAVRLKVHFDVHGASPAEIDEVIAHAAAWSPVLNTVRNPVPIEIARA